MNAYPFASFFRRTAIAFGCTALLQLTAPPLQAQVVECTGVECECDACREFLEGCTTPTAPGMMDSSTPLAPGESLPSQPQPPGATDNSQMITPEIGAADLGAAGAAGAGAATMPSPSDLASSYGGGMGDANIPSMIGDFFGGGFNYQIFNGATVATAGGDRRVKLAENNSPFPRDRVFFNYHHFHNSVIDVEGDVQNLDRYTFGWEKAFLDDQMSFEIRAPFVNSVSSNPNVDDPVGRATEWGNISLVAKGLLFRNEASALSTGLAIVLPTGDDFVVGGDTIDNIFRNDAVHLQPFLGFYHSSSARAFHQAFVQLDFDTAGNEVTIGSQTGVLNDSTLLFLDYSFGYWIHRDNSRRWMRAIAPMVELHYTTSVTDQDYGPFRDQGIFVNDPRRDVLNITGGVFFELTPVSMLKIGAVAPLRTGSDKQFDSEIGVQFSRLY